MYVQWFIKGISAEPGSLDWPGAQTLLAGAHGIKSNWWRSMPNGTISSAQIASVLTDANLDRHVHDYANFGPQTPFISVAAGCVERNILLSKNYIYPALETALDFATDSGLHAGLLFFGWVIVGLNPAVRLSAISEEIRNLNTYRRWSPFQLEGEITTKVYIPANQICRVELWNGQNGRASYVDEYENANFVEPTPITNVRQAF